MKPFRRLLPPILVLALAVLPACDSDDGDDDDLCNENDDCATALFCDFPDGACDTVGTCEARPPACPDVDDPVCGCDGATYGNACEANSAGQSIDHDGPC